MSNFVLRLCLLMAVAFGSRPCRVAAVDDPRQSVAATVHERAIADGDAYARASTAGLRIPVNHGSQLRTPTSSPGGGASASPVDLLAWSIGLVGWCARGTTVHRRTPCAACGDGSPYDATAPPASA